MTVVVNTALTGQATGASSSVGASVAGTGTGGTTTPPSSTGSSGGTPTVINGTNGTNGTNGKDGTVWRMGVTDPANTLGLDGDSYLNTVTGGVFQRSNGAYLALGTIRGPAGTTGAQGIPGTPGTNGSNGVGFRPPVSVAYAAIITLDCTTAETFYVAPLTGNLTLNLSGAVDGQKILVSIPQDASGNRQLTLGSMVAFSDDLPSVVLSTAASKEDVLGFQYRASVSKYRLISYTKGF